MRKEQSARRRTKKARQLSDPSLICNSFSSLASLSQNLLFYCFVTSHPFSQCSPKPQELICKCAFKVKLAAVREAGWSAFSLRPLLFDPVGQQNEALAWERRRWPWRDSLHNWACVDAKHLNGQGQLCERKLGVFIMSLLRPWTDSWPGAEAVFFLRLLKEQIVLTPKTAAKNARFH